MHTGFVTGPSLITFNTTFVYLISSAFPFLDEICSPFMLFVWFVTNLNLFFFILIKIKELHNGEERKLVFFGEESFHF